MQSTFFRRKINCIFLRATHRKNYLRFKLRAIIFRRSNRSEARDNARSMNREPLFLHPRTERWKIPRKYPPLLSSIPFPFPWPARGRRKAGPRSSHQRVPLADQSVVYVPLSQIGYVIFDLVADPVPGLHHRIFAAATIAR